MSRDPIDDAIRQADECYPEIDRESHVFPPRLKRERKPRAPRPVFVIDKGVAAPLPNGAKYPFRLMQVGDSFAVPAEQFAAMNFAAAAFGRRTGMVFTCRRTSEAEGRAWRLS